LGIEPVGYLRLKMKQVLVKNREDFPMYIVIMAGGKGTRFWPISTQNKPKQLLNLAGDLTMVQQTVKRVSSIVAQSKVFLVTEASLETELRKQLPEISPENILVEPIGKNTLPCIGLASLYIKQKTASGIMVVLPADHLIRNEAKFLELLSLAKDFVIRHDALVTFGIVPTRPETGYGYIGKGRVFDTVNGVNIFSVQAFIEKPSKQKAIEFCQTGQYLWNSGMFVWRVPTLLDAIEKYAPSIYDKLLRIDAAIGTPNEIQILNQIYPKVEVISIDYGIMEKADNVVVIPADIGWDDVGSWAAMQSILKRDISGNVCSGKHLGIDTENCVIYSPQKLVATIGIKDLIIVESAHALLVCPVERAQEVKTLVEKLEIGGLDDYL